MGIPTKVVVRPGYYSPQIKNVSVYRCDSSGKKDDSGAYFKISATRTYCSTGEYSNNRCQIRYCYRQLPNGSYSGWTTILGANTLTSNSVTTGALVGTLSADESYEVVVGVADTVGSEVHTSNVLAYAGVFLHKDGEMNSIAIGEVCSAKNMVTVAEKMSVRVKGGLGAKNLSSSEDLYVGTKIKVGGKISINDTKDISIGTPGTDESFFFVDNDAGLSQMMMANNVGSIQKYLAADQAMIEIRNSVDKTSLGLYLRYGGVLIRGLTAPSSATDATNKEYVDDADEAVKAYAKTTFSNPNLLGNWYLSNPVNQRGKTRYTANDYCLDRWWFAQWQSTGQSVDVLNGRISVCCTCESNVNNSTMIRQTLEHPEQLSNMTVTLSAKLRDVAVLGKPRLVIYYETGSGSAGRATADITDANANSIVSVTKKLPSDITKLYVTIGNDANSAGKGAFLIEIESMKLELGSVSTLANDAPPKFSEQLLECQRYYMRYASDGGQWLMGASNSTVLYAPLHLPVPMRAHPGLKYANINIYPYVSGGKVEITKLELAGASGTQDFILYAYHASGEVAAKSPGCIRFTSGGYVELSAEI